MNKSEHLKAIGDEKIAAALGLEIKSVKVMRVMKKLPASWWQGVVGLSKEANLPDPDPSWFSFKGQE